MGTIIACNLNSYGRYRDTAYEHLARIGLTNVEIPCPDAKDAQWVSQKLQEYGLTATSLSVSVQLDADDVVYRFRHDLETVAKLNVGLVFTSVRSGEIDRDYVYGRLSDVGEAAALSDVVVALETHPDLVTNGDVALETMRGVNHPNIRVNYDTANVYYYNEGADAVEEFEKIVDHVAAIHLKDTSGEFRAWHFPALGEGIVDFPEIFSKFSEKGKDGPYTLEIEGIESEDLSRLEVEKRVEESLEYLNSKGLVD